MILFWLSSSILIAIAIIFIAWPLMRVSHNDDEWNNEAALRAKLNKAFYKDRLSELEMDAAEGLIDSDSDLVADLKQSLLDDIPTNDLTVQVNSSISRFSTASILLPSILLLMGVSYGLYAKFGSLSSVIHWQEVNDRLPDLEKKLSSPDGLSEQDMNDLQLALRTKLYQQPNDAQGWILLGRVYLTSRDADNAISAMRKAYQLNNQNPDVILGYAQALMLSPLDNERSEALFLLKQLAKSQYSDPRVFSMLAFDAYEKSDYITAINYWTMMQKMIGKEDNRYDMLQRSIENAQSRLNILSPVSKP